jgi:hypothetical protein
VGRLAHLQPRGRETDCISKAVFNSDTKCTAWMGPSVAVLERRESPSAAANTNFEVESGEELVENCASNGAPSNPLEAAARGVTSAGSAGPHRAPLPPTPWGSLPDKPRDQATAKTECWEILDYRATGYSPLTVPGVGASGRAQNSKTFE